MKEDKRRRTKNQTSKVILVGNCFCTLMPKKRRASKKDVVYVEPVTQGQNPWKEPTDEHGNPEPRAWNGRIRERINYY